MTLSNNLLWKFILLIHFWLCWVVITMLRLSLVVASGGYSLVALLRRLVAVASLAVECRFSASRFSSCGSRLESTSSVVVTQGLSCTAVCGISLDQRSNLCLLDGRWILNHWAPREVLSNDFYFKCLCSYD